MRPKRGRPRPERRTENYTQNTTMNETKTRQHRACVIRAYHHSTVSFYLPFTAHHQFRILNFVFWFFWRIVPSSPCFHTFTKKNCFKNLHPLERGGGKKISKPPPNPSILFLIEASKSRNQNESWIWQRCACVTTFPFAEACFEQTRRFRINWEFHVVDETVYKFISTYIRHIKWHFIHVKTVWQVNRIICHKCIFTKNDQTEKQLEKTFKTLSINLINLATWFFNIWHTLSTHFCCPSFYHQITGQQCTKGKKAWKLTGCDNSLT